MSATFELHELRRLKKRRPFQIPSNACSILGVLGLEIPARQGARFSLKHRRDGVEIMFVVQTAPNQSFSWSVSGMLNVNHKTFAQARAWVHAYAAGHGQEIDEIVKPRETLPTGADRKLLAAGGCKESWLNSDVPKLFAEAATRCQHAGAFCITDGYCHYGSCDMLGDAA